MIHQGNLNKMRTELDKEVHYFLTLGGKEIHLNEFIGHNVQFTFSGKINCIVCGNTTSKSFAQGFCYTCMIKAPQNAECILRPELCRAHLGEGRDMEWEKKHHLQPHVVYLAAASGLKVGVTRSSQIPTRWIDQGAWKAIRLAETPNRFLAGEIEVYLKQSISDKTHWQKMLRNLKAAAINLEEKKEQLHQTLPEHLQEYRSPNNNITELTYPVEKYPLAPKSINFDKTMEIGGKLTGIRGQYLIFDNEQVFNVRRHNGYHVHLNA